MMDALKQVGEKFCERVRFNMFAKTFASIDEEVVSASPKNVFWAHLQMSKAAMSNVVICGLFYLFIIL